MEELFLNGEIPAGEAGEMEISEAALPEEENGAAAEAQYKEAGGAPGEVREGPEEALTAEEEAAWAAFQEAYPELTPENIPEDVFRLVGEGETPVNAMRQVELAQLKAENRALKQKLAAAETARRNRFATPGSMLGRAPAPEDAFLAGLEL